MSNIVIYIKTQQNRWWAFLSHLLKFGDPFCSPGQLKLHHSYWGSSRGRSRSPVAHGAGGPGIYFLVASLEVWLPGPVLLTVSAECPDSSHPKNVDVIPKSIESIQTPLKRWIHSMKSAPYLQWLACLRSILLSPLSTSCPFFLSTLGHPLPPLGPGHLPTDKGVPEQKACGRMEGMMYFSYKLNKQGGNIQPWHTPFPS